ncbi:MAG: hypothetical protein NXI22_08855 [bacterium]|nr:hypothetical protein [bacterium]
MLYLGIDQHALQLNISLRDDSGDVLQARQVSNETDTLTIEQIEVRSYVDRAVKRFEWRAAEPL